MIRNRGLSSRRRKNRKIQCFGCKRFFDGINKHLSHCKEIHKAKNNTNGEFVLNYGSITSHASHSQFMDAVTFPVSVGSKSSKKLPYHDANMKRSHIPRQSVATIDTDDVSGRNSLTGIRTTTRSAYSINRQSSHVPTEPEEAQRTFDSLEFLNGFSEDVRIDAETTEDVVPMFEINDETEELDHTTNRSELDHIQCHPCEENTISAETICLDLTEYQRHLETKFVTTRVSRNIVFSMNLFALLQVSNSPLHLYDSLRLLITESSEKGTDVPVTRAELLKICHGIVLPSCDKFPLLAPLQNHRNNQYVRLNSTTDNTEISVSRLPFVTLVTSLLSDKLLTNKENLLINSSLYHDRHYNNNVADDNVEYGDIHTSYWFQGTKSLLCQNDSDLLCPVIFFIDGVSIDSYGRLSLEPVSFTLGIYKRRIRQLSSAWRILGFIERTDHLTSADKHQTKTKRKHYHDVLKAIFEEYLSIQGVAGGLKWKLPINGELREVTLKFSVSFIIGDAVGHDKLTGRYSNYHSTKFISRDCNCDRGNSSNPDYSCTFVKAQDIRNMSEEDKNSMGYHHIPNNAFDDMCFGILTEYGINGCTPHEKLHFWNLGVVSNLLKFFFNRITVPARDYLFRICKSIACDSNRQSDRDFPQIGIFRNSIDKPKLTGEEVLDQLFLVVLGLSSSSVRAEITRIETTKGTRKRGQEVHFVDQRTNSVKRKRQPLSRMLKSINVTDKWFQFFEWTLCLDQCLSSDNISRASVSTSVAQTQNTEQTCDLHKTLVRYMKTYKSLVEIAGDVNTVNLQTMKFHALLHIPRQIRLFGSPANYAGFRPEATGKDFAKNTARRTQKRQDSISKQTLDRYVENLVVGLAQNVLIAYNRDTIAFSNRINITNTTTETLLDPASTMDDADDILKCNPYSFTFQRAPQSDITITEYIYGTNRPSHNNPSAVLRLNDDFLESLTKFLLQKDLFIVPDDVDTIHGYTTLKCKGMMIRADPNYQRSKWFDWVNVEWSYGDGSSEKLPAQVLTFLDLDKSGIQINPRNPLRPSQSNIAIIKSSTKVTSEIRMNEKKGKLTTELVMESSLRAVGVENISEVTFVIPTWENRSINTDPCHHVLQVKPMAEWRDLMLDYRID